MEKFPDCSWRLLIADNDSTDKTWSIINSIAAKDSRVVAYRLTRKFNLDAALTCGLDLASADAVIIMCSDLQDPPEFIPRLIESFEKGFDQGIVKIRERAGIDWRKKLLVSSFYNLLYKLSEGLVPKNISDFRLASKSCYESARKLREQKRFLRGQFAWVGYPTEVIEITRPERKFGNSHFTRDGLLKNITVSIFSILAYSSTPLIFLSIFGIILFTLSLLSFFIFILFWIIWGVPFVGFGVIVSLLVALISGSFAAIGVISFYISAIYDEVKNRPLYLIRETVNISEFL
jgi:dolichol-phosphate mannosyltransferase